MSPIIKKTLHTLTGLLLAVVFVAPAQAEEVTYYHLDALGSTVAATDDTGVADNGIGQKPAQVVLHHRQQGGVENASNGQCQ